MTDEQNRRGKTLIAPDVLLTIARLTALGQAGVARTAPVPPSFDKLFQRSQADGVRIDVRGQTVTVDLFLIMQAESHVRDVSRAVQTEVARAIHEMVGMEVTAVNVHVEDVAYVEAADKPL
ncbi:MAG: Asp23/Gls24 family envelope stress response protein [Anaerolineales bacterium]|nr:Asp23/Gls24 family envelope stress response protein [Anaerolineales bacterium]